MRRLALLLALPLILGSSAVPLIQNRITSDGTNVICEDPGIDTTETTQKTLATYDNTGSQTNIIGMLAISCGATPGVLTIRLLEDGSEVAIWDHLCVASTAVTIPVVYRDTANESGRNFTLTVDAGAGTHSANLCILVRTSHVL